MPGIHQLKAPHILISRTDAIGDVVLTLPMAAYIKALIPGAVVLFFGRTYTQPVVDACTAVDGFINYDEIVKLPENARITYLKDKKINIIIHVFPNKQIAVIARKAGIKLRIGTTNRLYHWFTCNKLVKLSRKKSDLHEAQLNLALLRPLSLKLMPSIPEIIGHYCFEDAISLPKQMADELDKDKFNLILHPKSHGSGMEWGLDNFAGLISKLPPNKFRIFITGSETEKQLLNEWIATLPGHVVDMTGKMTLPELIAFIFNADGLLASGTGPLHLAAAAGIHVLGLFPSMRPIHAGRWAPLGKSAGFLESGTDDLVTISINRVMESINGWGK